MNDVLRELGVSEPDTECLLVGAKIPGRQNPNGVSIEPEDGKWCINLFDGLLDLIETEFVNHPSQNLFFSDEPSMRDKPENIRRDSVRIAVEKMLKTYDSDNGVRSFAGSPAPISDYYIVPVLQLPSALFQRFRPLREPITFNVFTGCPSLIHAAVFEVLAEAHDELLRPEPGRHLAGKTRSPEEIVRRAATSFMYTPGIAIGDKNFGGHGLFERFNLISSLMYEGAKGTGTLLLANPASGAVDLLLEFTEPVPFREHRWCRKALQLASSQTSLITDCEKIFGLGNITSSSDPWNSRIVFKIEFLDHYSWRLSCGGEIMLVSEYGIPSLPQEKFPQDRLLDTYKRLFPDSEDEDIDRFAALFKIAASQRHGSMLIVANDAASEADRLRAQGTKIEPTILTPDLYQQVSGVDGAVIIDPHGVCHAIGVILDGLAKPECTPSRGARYNSGIRYVDSSDTSRLAIVVSDDQTVDVIPVLRPRIKRSSLEKVISELETANSDNYNSSASWLTHHRFCLNQKQCDRINAALRAIHEEPMEVGEIRLNRQEFAPDPNLNDSYFESEDREPISS